MLAIGARAIAAVAVGFVCHHLSRHSERMPSATTIGTVTVVDVSLKVDSSSSSEVHYSRH